MGKNKRVFRHCLHIILNPIALTCKHDIPRRETLTNVLLVCVLSIMIISRSQVAVKGQRSAKIRMLISETLFILNKEEVCTGITDWPYNKVFSFGGGRRWRSQVISGQK